MTIVTMLIMPNEIEESRKQSQWEKIQHTSNVQG